MRRTRLWFVFGLTSSLALAGLAWLSWMILDLESAERSARSQVAGEQRLGLALWRMDSWLGPLLARESARSQTEYRAHEPELREALRSFQGIQPQTPLRPASLFEADSEYIKLYFEVSSAGEWSSPQVPRAGTLSVSELSAAAPQRIGAARQELRSLEACVSSDALRGFYQASGQNLEAIACELVLPASGYPSDSWVLQRQQLDNRVELSKRAQALMTNQQNFSAELARDQTVADQTVTLNSVGIGIFVPIWLSAVESEGEPSLCFLRQVRSQTESLMQGFIVDWAAVQSALLAEVQDLTPGAQLVPYMDEPGQPNSDRILASVPARLHWTPAAGLSPAGSSPGRVTLALAWGAALLALVSVGFILRISMDLGERRSRFASNVTHELRTPLTTFRMYTEMLAKGMVPEARRAEYLETLQSEAQRLSTLVENVLTFSRLEEGRGKLPRERIGSKELIEHCLPLLQRRVQAAGAILELKGLDDEPLELRTDCASVSQILFNLIDNACKYACSCGAERIELSLCKRAQGGLQLRVRDFGPGVLASAATAIFQPFERGQRDAADPQPGVGLGLALSRTLARDLGGDLLLESQPGAGACFCLNLPA